MRESSIKTAENSSYGHAYHLKRYIQATETPRGQEPVNQHDETAEENADNRPLRQTHREREKRSKLDIRRSGKKLKT